MISQPRGAAPYGQIREEDTSSMQNPPPPPPPPGSQPPQYIPPPAYPQPAAGYPAPVYGSASTRYGGFWIRVVARIIDGVIIGVPIGILFGIIIAAAGGLASTSTDQNAQTAAGLGLVGAYLIVILLATVGSVVYQVYFWGISGSTLGMRVFKLRVVDANTGGPIGIGRAIVRWLMSIVNGMACYIGWIWVAFDPRKQGWHDKVANSVVIQG
jgi:uncharacterized RDD family membrane protein YckC